MRPTMPAFDLPELGWVGKGGHDDGGFEVALIEPIVKYRDKESHVPHKPHGGLWTSPVVRDEAGVVIGTGWTRWCGIRFGAPARIVTIIEPDPVAPVWVIENHSDLLALEEAYPWPENPLAQLWKDADRFRPWPYIDWDALALDFAAVYLTEDGQEETHLSFPGLNGWDCATVLWLAPRVSKGNLVELPPYVLKPDPWDVDE